MQKQVDPLTQLIAMRASGEIDADEFKLARQYLAEEMAAAQGYIAPTIAAEHVRGEVPQPKVARTIDMEMLAAKAGLGVVALIVVLMVPASIIGWLTAPHGNSASHAAEKPTQTAIDPCTSAASSVARATGGTVGSRTGLGSITINHSATSEVHLFCPDGMGPQPVLAGGSIDAISMYTRADPPTAHYFDFVAKAASALTGASAMVMEAEARECLRAAKLSRGGVIYRNVGQFGFMCDGGPAWGRAYDVAIEGAFPASALGQE